MTGTGGEPSTTNGLQYPMVELFTGGMILPLMFVNAAATCYLLSLTAPLACMDVWKKALETTGAHISPDRYRYAGQCTAPTEARRRF